jgi:para-nitrobenzyl esterase
MPPPKPAPWLGVRDATTWGSKAPRVPGGGAEFTMILDRVNGMLGAPGEDCLVVNIWTPALKDGRKRPSDVQDSRGRVHLKHRQQPDLTDIAGPRVVLSGEVRQVEEPETAKSMIGRDVHHVSTKGGVEARVDLVAALEWVRDNIENFGGDPRNVFIFGESGGGMKTSYAAGHAGREGAAF